VSVLHAPAVAAVQWTDPVANENALRGLKFSATFPG
jgi:hypothetical protein